jgi:asparagine synthase (glutamine-hydrolysing)
MVTMIGNARQSTATLALDIQRPWRQFTTDDSVVAYAGDPQFLTQMCRQLADGLIDCDALKKLLGAQYLPFGLLIETPTVLYAVTDHIRSFPIYYSQKVHQFVLGNSARGVQKISNAIVASKHAVGEYLLSGYVHTHRTLFEQLYSLPPGHFLSFEKRTSRLIISNYYKYLPNGGSSQSRTQLNQMFGETLDEVFQNLVQTIDDRPVWIPLSGGLDSRLILCKLIEHGVKNITTFTYGNKRTHEMAMARDISSLLNVPWLAVPSRPKRAQRLYASATRVEYAEYSDGLHMTPVYLDFEPIFHLHSQNRIPTDAILINGYSGDFLFGGHIPESLALCPCAPLAVDQFMKKNTANINTPNFGEVREEVRTRLLAQIDKRLQKQGDAEGLASQYEYWDWSERQPKAVVNGQRLYEFFGYDWRLPFWDRRLLDFWASVPVYLRLNQNLHLQYLERYNYKNAFSVMRSTNQIWPTQWRWIPTIGSVIGIACGSERKTQYYEKMFFRSYFNYQLSLFGHSGYKRWYKISRPPHVVPFASMARLEEMNIDTSDFLT